MKYKILDKSKYLDFIQKYGSPLYIYDGEILKDRCTQMYKFKKELENSLDNIKVNIHYSIKANNNPAILKIVKENGLYVDSMSPLELDIGKKCGFKTNQILYVCNNIDAEEMKKIHEEGLLVCLDSISQIKLWGELFPNTDILVRINPGVEGIGHTQNVVTAGKTTKFGISEENIEELLNIVNKYNLNIVGIHLHLGSLFLNDKISEYTMGIEAGLRIIKQYFKEIKIVDLGGGFGIPYKDEEEHLDLMKVANELEKILIPFLKEYPGVEEIKFEPGRFIPCESGIIAGEVTAVKHENGIWWVGTDIGMNILVRPSMYDAYHEIDVLSDNSEEIVANICGNVCESGDILGKQRKMKLPEIGDIVIVYDAGAYGYSMASNYTGRGRPAEILVTDGEEKLIRKRENINDLENNIVW